MLYEVITDAQRLGRAGIDPQGIGGNQLVEQRVVGRGGLGDQGVAADDP